MVCFGVQQRVQRLLYRCTDYLVQMRLNAPFVDLYHRP